MEDAFIEQKIESLEARMTAAEKHTRSVDDEIDRVEDRLVARIEVLESAVRAFTDPPLEPGGTPSGDEETPPPTVGKPVVPDADLDPPVVPRPDDGEPPKGRVPVGLNLTSLNYYSREQPFVDLSKGWSGWVIEQPKADGSWGWEDSGVEPDLDRHGYLRTLPEGTRGRTIWKLPAGGASGPHVLSWEGKAKFSIGLRSKEEWREDGPNAIVWDLPEIVEGHESIAQIRVTDLDPSDPLRNMKLVPQGVELIDPAAFRTRFIERWDWCAGFRYMDWGETNNSENAKWEDRPRLEDRQWASKRGLPLEVLIAHANATQTDPWFCVPHAADDDYVVGMAKLIGETLAPGLTPSFEFSNEISFNWIFGQTKYAEAQGKEQGQNWIEWQAGRIAEIFEIVRMIFDADQVGRPVRLIVGSQSSYPDRAKSIFEARPELYELADAIATAPYFGGQLGPENDKAFRDLPSDERKRLTREFVDGFLSLDDDGLSAMIAEELNGTIRGIRRYPELMEDLNGKRSSDLHPLRHFAYEGGTHFLPPHRSSIDREGMTDQEESDRWNAVMRQFLRLGELDANRIAMPQYLAVWDEAGGEDFFYFASIYRPVKHGDWGLVRTEDATAENSPKLAGVLDFARAGATS